MLDRYGQRFRKPLGDPDPVPDDWSVATLVGMTVEQLRKRAADCPDELVAGWLLDLMLDVGPTGPAHPARRQEIAGLISGKMNGK